MPRTKFVRSNSSAKVNGASVRSSWSVNPGGIARSRSQNQHTVVHCKTSNVKKSQFHIRSYPLESMLDQDTKTVSVQVKPALPSLMLMLPSSRDSDLEIPSAEFDVNTSLSFGIDEDEHEELERAVGWTPARKVRIQYEQCVYSCAEKAKSKGDCAALWFTGGALAAGNSSPSHIP